MLEAYGGVPFNARLRGSVDGIPPAEMRRLLRGRRALRRGVTTHVRLHAALERRYADRRRDVRGELREAGFGGELIRANARKLERLVGRLERHAEATAWQGYGATTSYSEDDARRKGEFVAEAAAARPRRLVWDLGCNDGRYTRLAAAAAEQAVAMDADGAVVDGLFGALRAEGVANVLPLVVDLADPSPALGWRARERRPLWERGRPDLTLALALVHHLAISRNVPFRELFDWLASLGGELVIEFVTREDPMVERLLAAKREGLHAEYTREAFERLLEERYRVDRRVELGSGTRVLYHAVPRA
jgi:SAM-dependent methyltransferase